jgi:uncharacterized protein (TIGR02594 family)
MNLTAFQVAQKFIGLKEVSGTAANPFILGMLQLDEPWPEDDSVSWCSAFVNFIVWVFPGVVRSKSLRARSWLTVGTPVLLADAKVGWDVVVFNRENASGDPAVIDAPGHVGFYAGRDDLGHVIVLGGNQADTVCLAPFQSSAVLGVRRLLQE